MSTLKQSMLLAGQPLSNNDPNMVITLKGADAAKVEITTIGNDSITYSFKEGVPTDTLYDLSLSFVYKDLYSLDVPLSLVNLGTVKDWEIVDTPISTTCWARGEELPFKVMKGEEDITSQLLDVKFTPSSLLKAGDTGSKSWTIESETAFGGTTVKAVYNFRLPTDLPEVSRTYEGTFNIAAYDGQELFVTPVVPDFKIAVGVINPVKYKIKFRNLRDATTVVRYIQASSSTSPINYNSQELKVPVQELWVNFGAPSEFEGEGTLVFGTAGTNSVLGKNRVDIKTNMTAYTIGFVIKSRTPELLVGKQGDIVEQTVVAKYNGDNVDMSRVVWDMANKTFFEVVSAKDDKVTWKIIKSNNTGADISDGSWIYLALDGSSASTSKASYIQSVRVKSKQQVTVIPNSVDVSMKKDGLTFVELELSDGNGTIIPINDPRVSSSFVGSYYISFVEMLPNGVIIKNTGTTSSITTIKFKVTGVPGEANVVFKVNQVVGVAVVDVSYASAGTIQPNQETTKATNTYTLNDQNITVSKVILTKYKNNPITGNAVLEIQPPSSTDNQTFTRDVKTGWTGTLAEITEYISIGSGEVYKATGNQLIKQAEITARITNNTFRYNDGAKTTIPVTLTQERAGQPDWTFATSTDIRNIMFDGTVKTATVVNNGGTFNITVTGNGTKGAGSVTFSIVENGVHYPKKIDLVAIDGLNLFVRDEYTTVYGGSNTDLTVIATAQWGGTNLGDVLEVTSDNPTVTVKSVSTVGGKCTTILTTPEGTELNGEVVNLTYTIKAGKPNAGNFVVAPVTFYVTSQKFMVYNLPKFAKGKPFEIVQGVTELGGTIPAKVVIFKDGVKMDPQDNDIRVTIKRGTEVVYSEFMGVDSDGVFYIKIRITTAGAAENLFVVSLDSDPTYVYDPGAVGAGIRVQSTGGTTFNAILNVDPVDKKEAVTNTNVVFSLKSGLDNTALNPYTLVYSKNQSSPETGNAFYNAASTRPTQGPGGSELSVDMKTGHTGDEAQIVLLVKDGAGVLRNGVAKVPTDKSPIVVTNNDNTLLGPNLVTPVTLQISQARWENAAYNLTGTTLINPTVEDDLFTVTDLVNNNDGTITFNVTATVAGSALFSFTVKDGEFEYPASIQLTVGMYPLDLGEGFIKDIEGNSTATVTVVQSVKLP